jgi:hypothetical protein
MRHAAHTHTHTHTHWHTHAHTRAPTHSSGFTPTLLLHTHGTLAHSAHAGERGVPQLANIHIARAHTRTHTHTPSLHPSPVTQAPTTTNALLERFVIEQGGPKRYHRLPYPRPLKRACALHLPRAYSFLSTTPHRWRGKHMRGVQCGAATYIILVDHDLSVLFVTIVRHGALLNNPPGHATSAPSLTARFPFAPRGKRARLKSSFFAPVSKKRGLSVGAKRGMLASAKVSQSGSFWKRQTERRESVAEETRGSKAVDVGSRSCWGNASIFVSAYFSFLVSMEALACLFSYTPLNARTALCAHTHTALGAQSVHACNKILAPPPTPTLPFRLVCGFCEPS